MRPFLHETLPRRVVFGVGAVEQIASETEALGLERVLLISGGSAAAAGARVHDILGNRSVGCFQRVQQHVPEALADEAVVAAKDQGADGLCCVGGGSATGLAKAVAIAVGLPIIAVPTTYAGSEITPVYGITGEHKRTGRDPRAQPRVVIYDPELTLELPPHVSAASGLNALAHAVAVLLESADPVASLHADEAVRVLAGALPAAVQSPGDLQARGDALYGAFLAASALVAGTGIHHRLCHALGGAHRLVHADVHAVLLPHTVAYERERGAPGIRRLATALATADPAAALHTLAHDLGAPTSLAAIGLPAAAIPDAARQAAGHPSSHDRSDVERLEQLLEDAHAGRPPGGPTDATTTREQGGPR